jgi:hypothetical protein
MLSSRWHFRWQPGLTLKLPDVNASLLPHRRGSPCDRRSCVPLASLLNLNTSPKQIAVANDNKEPGIPEWLNEYLVV